MPSQLRAEIRKDGRDLVGAFRALAPARAPIRIQRWTLRRLAVTVGVLLGAAIAVSLLWANLRAVGLRSPGPTRSGIAWQAKPPPPPRDVSGSRLQ